MAVPDEQRRSIPSVDRLLRALEPLPVPRPMALRWVRAALESIRQGDTVPAEDAIVAAVRTELQALADGRIRPVINATGVVIHTNLGRAPLAEAAIDAVVAAGRGYGNLEFDLIAGVRGKRSRYLEEALAVLCDAEAATVVNNCAAALVLIVRMLSVSPRDRVVISRGELVQIGGGFRVPDILAASGAQLCEVGTTNRTVASDYHGALDDRTAMVLRVHRSNFAQVGFVEEVPSATLASLAHDARTVFVEDLGSGATFDTSRLAPSTAGAPEPTPSAALAAGADLVCFSGDKLLGGPQMGVIAGRASLVARAKSHPLFRALRCDKLTIAAAQATVERLLAGDRAAIPVHAMLTASCETLRPRAERIASAVAHLPLRMTIVEAESMPGGGTLPEMRIRSIALALQMPDHAPQRLAESLRRLPTPIVGYVAADHVHLDIRTVLPRQDDELIAALRHVAAGAVS